MFWRQAELRLGRNYATGPQITTALSPGHGDHCLQAVRKPLHRVAPSLVSAPVLMRMFIDKAAYRDVLAEVNADLARVGAVLLLSAGACWWLLA